MPTKRRPIMRPNLEPREIPIWLLREFFPFGRRPPTFEAFLLTDLVHERARAELAEIWRGVRGGFLRSWIRRQPGTRPFIWWVFEAPEPRKIVASAAVVERVIDQVVDLGDFGLPFGWREATIEIAQHQPIEIASAPPIDLAVSQPNEPDPPVEKDHDPPVEKPIEIVTAESEAAYLDRLRLLSASERQRLPAGAHAPITIWEEGDLDPDVIAAPGGTARPA